MKVRNIIAAEIKHLKYLLHHRATIILVYSMLPITLSKKAPSDLMTY